MSYKKKPEPDARALSKKYGFSVNSVIRHWKNNKQDVEIAKSLEVDTVKLIELRKELEDHYLLSSKHYAKGSIELFTLE